MTELSDDARRLLHAGRTALSPTPQELASTREALAAKLAAVQASAPDADMSEPSQLGSTTHTAAASGGMLKVVMVTVTAASLAVGYAAWQHQQKPKAKSSPGVSVPSEPSSPPPGIAVPGEPVPHEPRPQASPGTASTEPRARSRDAARARARAHASRAAQVAEAVKPAEAEPRAEPPAPATPPRDANQLAREIELIRTARASMQQGRAEQTLETLDAYVAQFPNGALRDEQLALRATALCALGRMDAAQAVVQRLEAVAPRSPHLRRLERACRTNP
jgi:hypothetical protein